MRERREAEEGVRADADKSLLADRDDVGVAGEQVPHQGERQHAENSVRTVSELGSNRQGPARHATAAAARMARATMSSGFDAVVIASAPGEQALGPEHERGEEDEVLRQDLPRGVDLRAEILCDADDDAARQRAPKAAKAAQHHRLEGGKQPRRANRRIEVCPYRHAGRRRHHRQGDEAHGDRIDAACAETDEVGGRRLVADNADASPDRGAVEKAVQAPDQADRQQEDERADRVRCRSGRRGSQLIIDEFEKLLQQIEYDIDHANDKHKEQLIYLD